MPMTIRTFAASLICLSVLFGCQKPGDPVVPMTQEQWRRVDQYLTDELPENATPVGAILGEKIELVGWSVEPEILKAGEEFTLTLYWRALETMEEPWDLFIHIDAAGARQKIDHDAASGVLPIVHWPTDRIVIDRATKTADSGLDGTVSVYVGLYRDEERMPITEAGTAEAQSDGRLKLGQLESQWDAPTYAVRYADEPITLDGRIVERLWSRAPATSRWVHPVTSEPVESQHTWAKMLWDEEYLYVAIRGRDTDVWSTLTERDSDLWDEEVFEVYLDPKNDGRNYLELQVNPNNAVFDALFPSANNRNHRVARRHTVAGLETMVYIQGSNNNADDRDVYWSVEMRIPWSSMPDFDLPASTSDEFAVNFYRYDRNREDDETFTTAWSPVGAGSFHRPTRFGIARLTGGPSPGPNGSGNNANSE